LIESADELLVMPAPTLPELDYLVRDRIGPGGMVALLRDVEAGAYVVEDLTAEDYERTIEVMDRYEQVGFVDASILAMCERFNEKKLATLDRRHFGILRPRHVDALELLPEASRARS
jgi:uncharacterized protein